MRILFLTIVIPFSLGLFLNTVHAEVYKQVNPDGSVTFTDVAGSKDEKPVPLQPMSTFKATKVPTTSSTQKTQSTSKKYTSISITNPANESTIRDNAGNLAVTASVTPGLQSGHKMVLMDNGSAAGESASGSFKLSNMDRGAHSLTVQIQDKKGKVLISSEPITVYLHRRSALH